MNLKIDGLRNPEIIQKILQQTTPQYLSLNFIHNHPQYIGEVDEAIYTHIPIKIRKIGIFQNTNPLHIIYIAARFSLSTIQLNGTEPTKICEQLSAEGLEIIKKITHPQQFDQYEGVSNKLIITNPLILNAYQGNTPLFVPKNLYNQQKHYGIQINQHNQCTNSFNPF